MELYFRIKKMEEPINKLEKVTFPKEFLNRFKVDPKIKYEYQVLGQELSPIYGKAIWSLFYKPFVTEYKVRKAHEIARKRGIISYAYLVGIVKRL